MINFKINVNAEQLAGLFDSGGGLATDVLNQILNLQATEALGAKRHERSEERRGLRNRNVSTSFESLL